MGLRVRTPPGARAYVPCECCVLSGRGLCVGLITCLEELYRMWHVQWEWSRSPVRGRYDSEWGQRAIKKKKKKENSQNRSIWDKASIEGIPAGIGQHDTRHNLRSIRVNQQQKFRSFNRNFQDNFFGFSATSTQVFRPPRHRFFLVSLCPEANAEMVPKIPSCHYMLLM